MKRTPTATSITETTSGDVKKHDQRVRGGRKLTVPAERALTWRAREIVPRRRWLWVIIAIYFTIPVTILLAAVGNWTAAAVSIAVGVSIVVYYLPRAKTWTYTLRGDQLSIVREHRRGHGDELVLELAHYRTLEQRQMRRQRANKTTSYVVLIPGPRFALVRDVYLPDAIRPQQQVIAALERRFDQPESR